MFNLSCVLNLKYLIQIGKQMITVQMHDILCASNSNKTILKAIYIHKPVRCESSRSYNEISYLILINNLVPTRIPDP